MFFLILLISFLILEFKIGKSKMSIFWIHGGMIIKIMLFYDCIFILFSSFLVKQIQCLATQIQNVFALLVSWTSLHFVRCGLVLIFPFCWCEENGCIIQMGVAAA